jgi:hypothetical protein
VVKKSICDIARALEKRYGGADLDRLALACARDSDSLTREFGQRFFVPNQLVAPIAVHENVRGSLPNTLSRALCAA